jgi:membrane-associated protein
LNAVFLNDLQHFGYPALWIIVFIAAVGVPVSGSLLMFAAGAFAAFGDFNIFILFPVSLSAAVVGDNLGYGIGRWVGIALLDWIERQKRFRWMSPEAIEKGRDYFRRRTGWAVFLTRFLIVALGGPINILAGLERYSYRRFLFWDISGQALCALITLGLGFFFAESWLEVATIFGTFSSFFLAVMVTALLFVFILRRIRRGRAAKENQASHKDEELALTSEDESAHMPDQNDHPLIVSSSEVVSTSDPIGEPTEVEADISSPLYDQAPDSISAVEKTVSPTVVEQIEDHVESPIPD